MGHITPTPAGTYRANWRDPAGRQRSKTFRTKKRASAFLAEVESTLNRGTYVDPHAGRIRFRQYAERWLAIRRVGIRANERTISVMRAHVLPQWGDWPLSKIDHMTVQEWVSDVAASRAPATVAKCLGVLSMVLRSAVHARLIAVDPSEGVRVPSAVRQRSEMTAISREQFFGKLLLAVPADHRAIVCAAAGAGLRWSECVGLPWGAVDLDRARLRVTQVAVETSGTIMIKSCPKTRAGVRTVPIPGFLLAALRARLASLAEHPDPTALVFATRTGSALRRSNFRRQVWRPALVRAGLLGSVVEVGTGKYRATWRDKDGVEWTKEFTTEREAVAMVAERSWGGLRFHDLRHSYATWLVSDGLPVNVVQRVMGHQKASTTLNLYMHAPDDYDKRVMAAFTSAADFSLTFDHEHGSRIDEDSNGEPVTRGEDGGDEGT